MSRLVETGYVCIPDTTELADDARRTLGSQRRIYHELPQPGCDDVPASDAVRTFCPIFQGYPSSGCDVNCGDRLRQVCAGRVQHRGDTATWCTDLSDAHLRAARIDGIDTILPDATVIESAFLVTLPCARPGEEPQRQVGHLDTLPDHLAEPDVLPSGVVMIAPLDYDTVVWVVPMHELAALGRLPYREEFLDLAIPVTVKLGFKLYMRLEMVHG